MVILVTGASGFIGRRVALALSEAGHQVIGTYLTRKVWMPWPVRMVQVNLTDGDAVRTIISGEKPDAVIYCASRHKGITPFERIVGRVDAVKIVSDCTLGLPFCYLSSRKVKTDPASEYAQAQLQCEAIVKAREPRGTILRLPAIYGPSRRPYLKPLEWICPKWVISVNRVVGAISAWVENLGSGSVSSH